MKTCPVCSSEFEPTTLNQRFCPPQPGATKSRCGKAYANAKGRGTLDALLARGTAPGRAFDCEQCGAHCMPGENVPGHATRFCHRGCKAKWHRQHSLAASYSADARASYLRRRQRRARAQRSLDRARRGCFTPRTWYGARCRECGVTFVSNHPATVHCTKRCSRRHHRRVQKARQRGAEIVEQVSFNAVAERDRWTCGICDEAVDPGLRMPHYYAATLDHVIPIEKGGKHEMNNAQLAHFICNSFKGDQLAPRAEA